MAKMVKLIQAKYNIENNLLDTYNFKPETLCDDLFLNTNDLFNYLNLNIVKLSS